MKKIPIRPPLSLALSILLTKEEGRVISNIPKKEIEKIMQTRKKIILKVAEVDHSFNLPAPTVAETKTPSRV